MLTYHFIIEGKVQGVFFRASTIEFCTRSLITGWVRNLESGQVEVLATGNEEQLRSLREWLRKGSQPARVDKVYQHEYPLQKFENFTKLPTALVPLSMETYEPKMDPS